MATKKSTPEVTEQEVQSAPEVDQAAVLAERMAAMSAALAEAKAATAQAQSDEFAKTMAAHKIPGKMVSALVEDQGRVQVLVTEDPASGIIITHRIRVAG